MDTNGSGKLHEYGVPTFWATLAEKKQGFGIIRNPVFLLLKPHQRVIAWHKPADRCSLRLEIHLDVRG